MAAGTMHTVWAMGHVVTLASFTRIVLSYTVGLFSKGSAPNLWYKAAYLGALLSYSIVVLNTQGIPQLNSAYFQRALMDDNVQYAILVVYWFISKPVYLSLIPFATFSLFHCLTFIRTTVIPKLQPPKPAAPAGSAANGANAAAGQAAVSAQTGLDGLAKRIQTLVKGNYDTAMRFVAFTEMAIFAWVCIRAITFRGSFIAPLFLAQFIRLRYNSSPFTREAVASTTARIDNIVAGQAPVVQNGWAMAKRTVQQFAGAVQAQPGAQQPAAAGVRR